MEFQPRPRFLLGADFHWAGRMKIGPPTTDAYELVLCSRFYLRPWKSAYIPLRIKFANHQIRGVVNLGFGWQR